MANYTSIGLDLQSVVKRTYENLLYRSSFTNFLNTDYLGVIRQTGAPTLEVVVQGATTVNNAVGAPVRTTGLTPALATYTQKTIDLAELRNDYSFRVPSLITEAGIAGIIDGQISLQDAEIALNVDKYGYGKLNAASLSTFTWAPATADDYVEAINTCKATLFNNRVYDRYKLGLVATEYANLVSAMVSLLKFETPQGVRGVVEGEIANAFGVDIFPINANAITNNEKGYFASEIATAGDFYFSSFVEYNGNYPGFPGDYVVEGAVLFGAEVIQKNAALQLVASA